MSTTISVINMKGGVGKTTLAFNLAWYAADQAKLKVLAIDLDPQANLSQYFLGAKNYLSHLEANNGTVVDVFEQFSAPVNKKGSPTPVTPENVILQLREWQWRGGRLHLIPSRLELAWTLKNATEKAERLLPQFLGGVSDGYDLIIIDCAPTESILSTAAYRSSRYVIVPVRPEFLATIGLPLLARSLHEHRIKYQNQDLDLAGIIFNGDRSTSEQRKAKRDVAELAKRYGWPVFRNEVLHSDSYPTGSRVGTPIFRTKYARRFVRQEFYQVGEEFLKAVGLK